MSLMDTLKEFQRGVIGEKATSNDRFISIISFYAGAAAAYSELVDAVSNGDSRADSIKNGAVKLDSIRAELETFKEWISKNTILQETQSSDNTS